jgi:hypothetical protein
VSPFHQQYTGDNCLWTANPGGQEGIQLVLDNGSNNLCGDGSPRQVTQAFVCPSAGSSGPLTPNSWTAVNLPGSCEYTYTFETCAACASGCGGGPGPGPPGPNPPAPNPNAGGLGWGGLFCILTLGVALPLYCAIGAFLNHKKGARGAEMFKIQPEFWGSVFDNVKAGIVFTFTCGKSSGGSTGGGDAYAGTNTQVGCGCIVWYHWLILLCVLFFFLYDPFFCVVCCFSHDGFTLLFLAIVVPSPQQVWVLGRVRLRPTATNHRTTKLVLEVLIFK